jgi:DNA-binding MarR family transcriptional regulator
MSDIAETRDAVARVMEGWATARPELDVSSIGVIARVYRLATEFRVRQDAVLNRHGVRAADFAVVATLTRLGGRQVSQAELARELNLSAGTISLRLDRLEREGLLVRSALPGDQRRTTVELTDAGRELFDACVGDHLQAGADLLAGIDAQDREQLASLLAGLLGSLEDPGPDERLATDAGLVVAQSATAIRMRREVGLPARPGVLVRHVRPGGPAALAGVRKGDLIVRAAGRPMRTAADLREALTDGAELAVVRGVEELDLELSARGCAHRVGN